MLKPITSTKNFVRRNKTRVLTTALVITSTIVVLQRAGIKQHDEFLKDNDLYDAYYLPED